jgi:hypothetical protein
MVQIQSQQERRMSVFAVINLIPDIAIAWIASDVFHIGPLGFFAVLFGMQGVYLFLWLKTMLWSWFLFWISGRKKLTTHLEDFLYKNRFPQPPEFISGADDYFLKVSNNSTVPCPIRVKAAIELGTFVGLRTGARVMQLMQVNIAYEAALQQYSLRFPPRHDPEDE